MSAPNAPLVSAQWLLNNIDAPDVRIIDATWFAPFLNPPETGAQAYQKGHIPGAVFFDIDDIADPEAPYAHTVPPAHVFSARVRKLGLGDGHRIIAYDQNAFFASARAWWLFRLMGVEDVFVLDGGLQAWTSAGGTLEDLPPLKTERHFTPRVRADLLKTTAQMQTLAHTNTVPIIDARPAARFAGTAPEPREGLRSGHIPGSLNIPGGACLTASGHMKPPADLAKVFSGAGIDTSIPLVTSCGSGVTAALTALALATLGNDQVAVYDGSWTEWASDPDNLVNTSAS